MNHPTPDIVLDILNKASATLIDLDPDSREKLAQLSGKTFCLEISAPPIKLYLLPTPHGIEFRREVEASPEVTLSGSLLAFVGLRRGASSAPHDQRVTIHGDAELGQALHKILGQLDLDWEELLSHYIGDTPARKLANVVRELAEWGEKSFDLTRENAADYLREEKLILATPSAVARFEQTLHQTRADVDRLTQRIARIKRDIE